MSAIRARIGGREVWMPAAARAIPRGRGSATSGRSMTRGRPVLRSASGLAATIPTDATRRAPVSQAASAPKASPCPSFFRTPPKSATAILESADRQYRLVTTLMEPQRAAATELAARCRERWKIETGASGDRGLGAAPLRRAQLPERGRALGQRESRRHPFTHAVQVVRRWIQNPGALPFEEPLAP